MKVLNNGLEMTFLGHSTCLFKSPSGKSLLVDPWLSGNPRCPASFKDGPDQLDYMLITHGHYDHIADAVAIAVRTKALAVAVFETASWLHRKGVAETAPMNKGGTMDLRDSSGISVAMVHADHSCGISEDDGTIIYGGEACGFVIRFENGYKVYHAGDTAVFGDMALIAEIYKPDLCLLPIGDRFVMSPKEAAYACRLLNARRVVPIHYGTFPLLTGTPEMLKSELSGQDVEVLVLEPGETMS